MVYLFSRLRKEGFSQDCRQGFQTTRFQRRLHSTGSGSRRVPTKTAPSGTTPAPARGAAPARACEKKQRGSSSSSWQPTSWAPRRRGCTTADPSPKLHKAGPEAKEMEGSVKPGQRLCLRIGSGPGTARHGAHLRGGCQNQTKAKTNGNGNFIRVHQMQNCAFK